MCLVVELVVMVTVMVTVKVPVLAVALLTIRAPSTIKVSRILIRVLSPSRMLSSLISIH
ncbi:hypothetical protein D3C71_1850870 [compost metagenome]